MTEQQKRYAEIVKDYSDKTPTYWCVFNFDGEYGICDREYLFWWNNLFEKAEIIWHIFDLSCVLRMIHIEIWNVWLEDNETFEVYRTSKNENEYLFRFENKPILTYTEQELEQLNNNLENLWTT